MTGLAGIPAQRLHNHKLENVRLARPDAVIAWLGAVQAQEYAHAKWALALRLRGATEERLEAAFTDGAILRTHVMRPTWHFVLPEDIRWMQALTGPRIHAANARRYRELELDERTLHRSSDIIVEALAGGKFLTRPELGATLEGHGIPASGQRLSYIVMRAEIHGLICSGPRQGKQFTYARLSERAPHARTLPRDEALALLVRRYFTSHGPAQVNDFVWWSGLTAADTRAGLEMNGPHLISETIAGKTYWRAASAPTVETAPPGAILLPPYDEYISYRDRTAIVEPGQAFPATNAEFNAMIAIRGVIVGTWRRTLARDRALVETRPLRPLTAGERDMLAQAATRYADYLGLPVDLET